MKLALSVRVAESFRDKRQATMDLDQLADLAQANGYAALCMRASQLGTHTPLDQVEEQARLLAGRGLAVSMVTGDFPIPENSAQGPDALRNITPYLDLAQGLGADLLRMCMKTEEDITWAQRAADEAAERNLRLVHQCHTCSLFEEVEPTLEVLAKIGRTNFGLVYEPANLEACGQDYGPKTIQRLAPHIFNVYLQNQHLNPNGEDALDTWCRGSVPFDHIPIWDPNGIDFPSIMTTLAQLDYKGYVTIHQASADLGAQAAVEQSAKYLHGLADFQ